MKLNCTNMLFWAAAFPVIISLLSGAIWQIKTTVILPKCTLAMGIPLLLLPFSSFIRTAFMRVLLREMRRNYALWYEVITPAKFGFLLLLLTGLLVNTTSLQAQTCNCKEFIYVNEVDYQLTSSATHKFEINSGSGALTEIGSPWLLGGTDFPFPHGLGTDRNGYLYIGNTVNGGNMIRRLDCAGNLTPTFAQDPVNGFNTGDSGYGLFNVDSYDGFLYSNGSTGGNGRIFKWDPCTGALVGFVQLSNGGGDWGFHIDDNGKFYVTMDNGKIWIFTPTATDFTSNTMFFPVLELDVNPSYGGLNPAYGGQGLQGITTDGSGNIYVVEGDRDMDNTTSRILKFSSTLTFLGAGPIDNVAGDGGWNRMVGIVYSKTSNRLYTTSLNPDEDCVRRWTTNLTDDGVAIGPVPGSADACKGIAILSECCPTSATVNVASCGASTTDRVSLSDLLTCDGVICDGQWTLQPGSTNFTYNSCDVTGTPSAFPACATFTLSNSGVTNAPCAPYTVTVNASLLAAVTAQTIMNSQTVCPTDDPAAFTVTTPASTMPPGGTITYQWQSSTTSCTAGFTDISGANLADYDPGPVAQTTYFRVIARSVGCTAGVCADTSNCVTLTIGSGCAPVCTPPTATVTSTNATCTGTTANSNGSITISGFTAGQRYRYSAGATFNSGTAIPASITAIPVGGVIVNTLPNAAQQYTVRIYDATDANCFVDRVVSTTLTNCSSTTASCNCTEYIYLNEPAIGAVLKFEVGAGVSLTEVTGANGAGHWYPGTGVSELPSPHGLATDLNGNLYIGSTYDIGAQMRKFNCDGVIEPVSATTIQEFGASTFNMFSIGNTLYKSGVTSIRAFDLCTGQFIGSKQLGNVGASSFDWGLHYNEDLQLVYATSASLTVGSGVVWRMGVAELNDFSTTASPLINYGSTPVNPGDNFIPVGRIRGITSDNDGNMYIVDQDANLVYKYNSSGQFISSATGSTLNRPIGIVWSETTNRLYLSNETDDPAIDCISVIDAGTMTFLGTGAPNPNLPINNFAKAIAIIKECCPANVPSTFTENVCGAVGSKFYLNQEAFNTCDGIVCGSSWTPTALSGATFDPCDNSVTLTGAGCSTFTLNIGAVTSTGCAAQSSTFSICSSLAPVLSNPSGPQSICEGSSGSNITVNSTENTANSVRFVRFTTDQMALATPTATEAANIYAGAALATITPTGGASPYTATLTAAAAGWTGLAPGTYYVYAIVNPDQGASCRPVEEIVVTIVDKPEVAVSSGALCAGSIIDLNSLVTGNSPAGTLSFHTTLADANAGTNPFVNTVVIPSANTTYYVRSTVNATCYTVVEIPVTVSTPPTLTANNGQVCTGGSINLATLVTNGGGGTLSYFTTLANAQNNTNTLISPVVSLASATNYFIRSTNAAGCYTIQNVVVSLAAANCGAIQVSGPN